MLFVVCLWFIVVVPCASWYWQGVISSTVPLQAATTDAEDDLAGRDVYGFLAKQMHKEAGKNQEPLKQDVMKARFMCAWPLWQNAHIRSIHSVLAESLSRNFM